MKRLAGSLDSGHIVRQCRSVLVENNVTCRRSLPPYFVSSSPGWLVKCVTMSSSGSEKFRQAADGAGGAATGADAAEDGTITAAACWLGGISDDEVHVEPLLQERGEAVATLARLRACSWLAGSLD